MLWLSDSLVATVILVSRPFPLALHCLSVWYLGTCVLIHPPFFFWVSFWGANSANVPEYASWMNVKNSCQVGAFLVWCLLVAVPQQGEWLGLHRAESCWSVPSSLLSLWDSDGSLGRCQDLLDSYSLLFDTLLLCPDSCVQNKLSVTASFLSF